MYQPPPGLKKVDEKSNRVQEDDAVKAFREKVEKSGCSKELGSHQRPLERYVGRRPNEPLTIADQVRM